MSLFKLMIIFFTTLTILFIVLFVYTHKLFSKNIYLHIPPSNEIPTVDLDTTLHYVKTDNLKIAYWYFPVENSKGVVILVHGYNNPGGKRQMLNQSEYLRKSGYSTALVDLRSFGDSEGNKVSFGVNEWKDVEVVYDDLKLLKENINKPIGFLGISMGASTSLVTLGHTGKGDFVIASVPFYDLNSLFKAQVAKRGFLESVALPLTKLSASLSFGFNYNNYTPRAVAKNIKVPVLLFLSTNDQEIIMSDSKKLLNEFSGNTEYWEAETSHDVYGEQPEEFEKRVLKFLDSVLVNTKN